MPIRQIYAGPLEVAPMSVLVDAGRMYAAWFPAKSAMKAQRPTGFSADVDYILAKQLEEAELVVLNKVDLLTTGQRSKLRSRLVPYMKKPLLEVSAATGEGLDGWFTMLMTRGEMLINLRAEADPELLNRRVTSRVDQPHAARRAMWKKRGVSKPGQPEPTQRVTRLLA